MYGITTLTQIQNHTIKAILTPKEFQNTYKYIPKSIKDAMQQASTLFPIPPTPITHTTHTHPPPQTPPQETQTPNITRPLLQPTLGQVIQAITNEKPNTKKNKWGAQAITKSYLCKWQLSQDTAQQWRKEEELLHPDNISLEHNIFCITQYHKTQREKHTTQIYVNCLNHTQSKYNKYIHPPLKITNLQLSVQECNPNKDIQSDTPTILIQEL